MTILGRRQRRRTGAEDFSDVTLAYEEAD